MSKEKIDIPEPNEREAGYIDMVKHILLCIFTFGIWQYVWIYKVTKYLNRVPNQPKSNETNQLLLCLFVPYYIIYWTYMQSKKIDEMAFAVKKDHSEITTMCLIFSIFFSLIAYILMQQKINEVIQIERDNEFNKSDAATV